MSSSAATLPRLELDSSIAFGIATLATATRVVSGSQRWVVYRVLA